MPISGEGEDQQKDSDYQQTGSFGGIRMLAMPVRIVRDGLGTRSSHGDIVSPLLCI
jgi:hypothetical protein